ncbi:hypothetical protein SAY86_028415 [Trapa natans]|uniref:Uncharacterized protein n=1 Tax=Trapa natans TaxID=22666 RepID=A0AAN7M0L6_TRANT|nr:hypothetical protein SAY86_028415 [Trapa natans]
MVNAQCIVEWTLDLVLVMIDAGESLAIHTSTQVMAKLSVDFIRAPGRWVHRSVDDFSIKSDQRIKHTQTESERRNERDGKKEGLGQIGGLYLIATAEAVEFE